MSSILVIGSGGHGKSVLDCVLAAREYKEIVFASNEDSPRVVPGYEVLDERKLSIEEIHDRFDAAVVAIGDNHSRLSKVRFLASEGISLPPLIHPRAYVSPLASVGIGSVVLAGAVVNAFADVGAGCIVNTCSVVEHECSVADGVHLSPGAVVAGGSVIGEGAWLCANSGTSDHVAFPAWSTLAGGSFLAASSEKAGLYVGQPAVLKRR